MNISKDSSDAKYQIKSYRDQHITVNDITYDHSLIVSAEVLIEHWRPQSLAELNPEDWQPVIQLKPELILLGTGPRFKMPHPSLLAALYQHHLKIESMDTGAACRTYTALLSEGRKVLAALLIQ